MYDVSTWATVTGELTNFRRGCLRPIVTGAGTWRDSPIPIVTGGYPAWCGNGDMQPIRPSFPRLNACTFRSFDTISPVIGMQVNIRTLV